jgi:hypothetical protein
LALSSDAAIQPAFARGLPSPGAHGVVVMTRNLYLGTDIDAILSIPDPAQIPAAVAAAWAEIQATDFPQRAEALADEIVRANPHVVGLQEMVLYRRQSPGDFVLGNPTPNATAVALNFAGVLKEALARRGARYVEVARVVTSDIELPLFTGVPPYFFDDIRYTDQDAILVRMDVARSNAGSAVYSAAVPLDVAGFPLSLRRGWTAVDVTVAGNTVRFLNTHLEIQQFAPVQHAQTQELLALAAASPHPVIVVGDLNSAANRNAPPSRKTLSYEMLLKAGFIDVWPRGRAPWDLGLTCCADADLRNDIRAFDQRLDLVLVRPGPGHVLGASHTELFGEEPADRTPGGLWPSDHAGLAALLGIERRRPR